MNAGKVLRTLKPGDPGTAKYRKYYGKNLVAVRYRYNRKRNMRQTTVEIVVDQGFWDSQPVTPPTWKELNKPV